MSGSQDIPDSYSAERILRDIRDVRLKLLDNGQSTLCKILLPLQVTVEEQVEQLQKLSSHCAARQILTEYGNPRLLAWMGIQ